MGIPKIIHQIWVGPKPPPMDLINTVKEHNPDYEHILWTEEKIEQNKHLLRNYHKYKLARPPAYNVMSDILRYDIVYHFGGFYMDTDFKFIKGIGDFFFKDNPTFLAFRENNVRYGDKFFQNALFAAIPQHPILLGINDGISNTSDDVFPTITREKAFSYFGPAFFTANIKSWLHTQPPEEREKVKIFSSHYFFPYYIWGEPTFQEKEEELDHIFAHHLWKNGL